ncbi:MAG TPA: hypothetical protein DFS52_07005 [Myxococcales bacterium]|nr:hypothetical protein [Myxococcales bacterium]
MSARAASFLAVLALAAVHLLAGRAVPERRIGPRALSAFAGVSVAYVFLHLLPDLARVQERFIEEKVRVLPWLEEQMYLAALTGLVATWALTSLAWTRKSPALGFTVGAGSFATYNAVIGLYAARVAHPVGLALVTFAFATHFLVNDRALERDFGDLYRRFGRRLLAASVFAGWVLGATVPISELALMWLFAALAGGILLNALKEELPRVGEGRVGPFVAGAAGFAALLLVSLYAYRR